MSKGEADCFVHICVLSNSVKIDIRKLSYMFMCMAVSRKDVGKKAVLTSGHS